MWLALCAMLSHALVPAALMAATGAVNPGIDAVKLTLCRASSQHESRGKPRPGLPAQHCALCAASATDLRSPRAELMPGREVARAAYPRQRAEWPASSLWHGPVQARGPPAMA
jgi:hypothetical protein